MAQSATAAHNDAWRPHMRIAGSPATRSVRCAALDSSPLSRPGPVSRTGRAGVGPPQPKLPPEATDKPSVVVRVRPVAELIKDARAVAKLVDQEAMFDAVEPGLGRS